MRELYLKDPSFLSARLITYRTTHKVAERHCTIAVHGSPKISCEFGEEQTREDLQPAEIITNTAKDSEQFLDRKLEYTITYSYLRRSKV